MRAPSHRLRFGAGVAIGAAAGVWLAHAFTAGPKTEVLRNRLR